MCSCHAQMMFSSSRQNWIVQGTALKCRYLVPITVVLNPTNLEHDGSEPDPTNLSADEDRIFFQSVTEALTACRNFAEVEGIARGSKEAVEGFRMLSPCVSKSVSNRPDCYAASLLQPEAQDRVFAICVAGDGNCLGMGTRSLSLLVFGTKKHHQELWC